MARRVLIGKDYASPFRVSISGQDANQTIFNRIIWDANQTPLRLWTTGRITSIAPPELGAGGLEKQGPDTFSFPSGLLPVIFAAYKMTSGDDTAVKCTRISIYDTGDPFFYRQSGAGLVLDSSGKIFGINFSEKYQISGNPAPIWVTPPSINVYYAVLRNIG